jgi:hypothetical protein
MFGLIAEANTTITEIDTLVEGLRASHGENVTFILEGAEAIVGRVIANLGAGKSGWDGSGVTPEMIAGIDQVYSQPDVFNMDSSKLRMFDDKIDKNAAMQKKLHAVGTKAKARVEQLKSMEPEMLKREMGKLKMKTQQAVAKAASQKAA